jgi:cysteine-rich repeat protein
MSTKSRLSSLPLTLALLACTDDPTLLDDAGSTTNPGSESGDTDGQSETETDTDTESTETGEPEPICGDGSVAADELCDDGNSVDDDGCSNACVPRACPITWMHIDDSPTINHVAGPNALTPAFDELPNGDIVVAQLDDSLGNHDIRVRVHTPAGAMVSQTFVEFSPLRDEVHDILADASGDVFVAGTATAGIDGVATVVRISGADGSEQWRFEADGESLGSYDWAAALELDDQGRVVVATMVYREVGGRTLELHALDPATGVSEWTGTKLGSPEDLDFATDLVFDAERARIYVAVADNRGVDWWEPVVLAFETPSEEPVLEAMPLGEGVDASPEYDVPLALTMSPSGRLWMASQETEATAVYTLISEIDPDDGSLLRSLDSRDLGIGKGDNGSGMQALAAGPPGGLAWAGFTIAEGIRSGFVLALDDDGQLDCVAGFEVPDIMRGFVASDGGIYAGGMQPLSGDGHGVLLRVR